MDNLSFIIPTYSIKGIYLSIRCILSLRKYLGDSPEVILVVDECPHQDNADIINKLEQNLKDLNVNIVTHQGNLGFAKTCNQGLEISNGKIKILLNNDTIFTKDITQEIIKPFEIDEAISIVGGKLLYSNDTIQHGGMEHVYNHIFYHIDWHKEDCMAFDANTSKYIIGVTGAFMAIRDSYYEKYGGLDETYFMGFEDSLYCINAWQNGYKVYYNHEIELIHDEGATRGNTDINKKAINENHFAIEKIKEKVFAKQIKNYDLTKLKKTIDFYNDDYKIKILQKLNDNAGIICLRRIGAMGDCILLTGIIEYLAVTFPKIDINILTGCPDVFKNNPYVNNVYNDGNKCIYDYVVDFDLSYESYPSQNIVESYFKKLFGRKFLPSISIKNKVLPKLYNKNPLNLDFKGNKVVSMHMALSWECRTLEAYKWDQVAQYLIDEGFQIIILGGKNDMAPAIENENIIDMRGKTTIQHCQEIISNTRLFISTDSGLFHIASTTETPIVGIFTCAAPTTRTTRLNNVSFVCPKNDVCRFQLTKGKDIVTFHKCKSVNKYECIKSIMPKDIIESIKNFKDIAND